MSPAREALFAVLLPTYKRPELVLRAIQSVVHQTISDWKLIVINDSPEESYKEAETRIASIPNTTYLKNEKNIGKNASLNRAFEHLQKMDFKGYVVFLDDDDWLDSTCLEQFKTALKEKQFPVWIVSNRSTQSEILTKNKTGHDEIRYFIDSLITKRFSGDATHCISFQDTETCRFPRSVKNAEEWFYFSQVARHSPKFFYLPSNGTLSEGYLPDGLTALRMNKKEKLNLYSRLLNELATRGSLNLFTSIYMLLRFGKIFV